VVVIIFAALQEGNKMNCYPKGKARRRPRSTIKARECLRFLQIVAWLLIILVLLAAAEPARARDPLPSWNDGAAKQKILSFVQEVTDPVSPAFVPPPERRATFDNDGTLWVEKPIYIQGYFVLARIKELAPAHPEWRHRQPFKAVLENDRQALEKLTGKEMLQLVMATHALMKEEQYELQVRKFLETWKHPRYQAGYQQLVYQPMLELLAYLRQKGIKTFICTGGGLEFVRQFSLSLYGIPPEQVIGSSVKYKYRAGQGGGAIFRLPALDLSNDGPGKPVGIQIHIGRRPLLAAGNSDGDLQMLEFTAGRRGPSLQLLVHHDDPVREYAYDKGTEKALAIARQRHWTVISIKNDFKVVFPHSPQ
jgi:hypothetical protein